MIAARKAFVILDGTLLPIDHIAADRPFYSGKHRKHGMNLQVLTDPFGKLIWASPALAGAVHNIRAAWSHGLLDALNTGGIRCWAGKAYQCSGPAFRVPFRGRWNTLSIGKKAVNRAHAKIRRSSASWFLTSRGGTAGGRPTRNLAASSAKVGQSRQRLAAAGQAPSGADLSSPSGRPPRQQPQRGSGQMQPGWVGNDSGLWAEKVAVSRHPIYLGLHFGRGSVMGCVV